MDNNRLYRARYLSKVIGVTDVNEIAEQAGLSREQASKAIGNDKAEYTDIKADFEADTLTGDYSRKYDVPKPVTLRGDKLESTVERYFSLLTRGNITLDIVKSYLISDDVKDSQITSILKGLAERLKEYRAGDLNSFAEKLLQIEQLPVKWAIDRKTLSLVNIYPSPMLSNDGRLDGVKYSRERIDWRKGLPQELATAVYRADNPLYIDGHKLPTDPETWGEREYSILASKDRERGFFAELADYLGYTTEEFAIYVGRLNCHKRATARKESQEPVDFKKVALIVAEGMAEFKAKQHSTVTN
ncbi:hypothetical protein PH235_10540 [Trichococcus sp. K1Tr]|uniref:hypothetical protein n=1 Tax=Trichococcus sp. K1Tr TaxID=3020847 RepID=UPI00232FC0F4|nr:hypothetical protein [Trichococcus sp. K1Tr]MDB6353996.1 hypothetical protein [Trichococcus sp. K1Tr]